MCVCARVVGVGALLCDKVCTEVCEDGCLLMLTLMSKLMLSIAETLWTHSLFMHLSVSARSVVNRLNDESIF